MSTPRQTIAAQLAADNAGWDVYPWAYAPATDIRRHAVAVYRTDVDPHPQAPGKIRHSVTIDAYGMTKLGERSEDELDTLLDGILLSLQRIEGVTFLKAERNTFKESFQGWTVTCSADSENVYQTTVRNERD